MTETTLVNEAPARGPSTSAWTRQRRGWSCLATFLVAPLGWFVRGRFIRRLEAERTGQGLVIILPGIEGRSFLNIAILQGLLDAGVPYGLDIVDWTTGFKGFILYHLRAWRRNQRIARQLADRIARYRAEYPERPVWLIGHSGGGGMALLTALALPADVRVTGIILLAPAVSPRFDLAPVRDKVERGMWCFSSYFDCLFVGLGTTIFGTLDGRHGPSAGMIGFRRSSEVSAPLQQIPYRFEFARRFHLGGHFGCVHRVFIAETIAPILLDSASDR